MAELPSNLATELRGHEGAVLAVRFNRQGTYCLSCGKDRTLRLWNPHKGAPIKAYSGHGYEVRDVSVASDNSKLASVGGDRQVFLWDVASGSVIRKFRGHDSNVNAVAFAAGDEVLVSGGYDQSVRVWDCRSRSTEAIQTMKAFRDSVTSVAVHEAEIFAASVDGTVRRFDLRMGRCYTDDLQQPITCIALTKDGAAVLAACLDSRLRLVDKREGVLLGCYGGHQHSDVKMDCALLPADAHAVGSSETGEVLYWDLVSEQVVLRFRAHSGVVTSLAVHPQQPMLLTCGVDGAIKVWTATAGTADASG